MKKQILIAGSLLLLITALLAIIGFLVANNYCDTELEKISNSLQIIVFIFTPAAGLFVIIQYYNTVKSNLEEKRWKKLSYLEESFYKFKEKNHEIIKAFEWQHLLKSEYLPFCLKSLKYDIDPLKYMDLINESDRNKIRKLDDFLEFIENIYFAVNQRLISLNDYLVYFKYYIDLVFEIYEDETDPRLKEYIDRYYTHIPRLFLLLKRAKN